MVDLLLFLLLGHFLGDFALQSDRVAAEKQQSKAVLSYHVVIYTLVITAALFVGLLLNGSQAFFTLTTVAVIPVVFVAHWIQDYLKAFKFNGTKQAFYVDQAVHVLVLFAIRILAYNG